MSTINRLKNIKKEYDLIIIGGGIYGATLLWEATLKGLSAILIEKGDFCNATSANSLKIIHGGLRYLQQFDLMRIRESSKELHTLMNIAPHLVQPLPCIIPTYRQLNKSKLAFRFAFKLHDLISFNRNIKIDPEKQIPSGKVVSINELHNLIPELELSGITGGALWYDAQDYNSERLVLSFIISAYNRGADAFNYMEMRNLIIRKGHVIGIKAYDILSRQELEIYGKITVNTTGPWMNRFNEHININHKESQSPFAKAVNIIIPRSFSDCAFGLKSIAKVDDNAQYNRFIFFVPWRGATMIGTWYFWHHTSPDDITLKPNEFSACMSEIQNIFPNANITSDEVCFLHLGVVPVERNSAKEKFLIKRHHSLIDHSRTGGPDNVISVLGVKYTTARNVAVKTVDFVSKKLGKKLNSSNSEPDHLIGGDIKCFDEFLQIKKASNYHTLTDRTIQHLAMNYGTKYEEIIELISDNKELGELVPGSEEAIKAELLYSIKKEFAYTLSDLLLRRTDIGSLGKPNDETINFCAAFMGKEMGWSGSEQQDQIESLLKVYKRLSKN